MDSGCNLGFEGFLGVVGEGMDSRILSLVDWLSGVLRSDGAKSLQVIAARQELHRCTVPNH